MHTGPKGLKMEILADNPKVSFTVMESVELMSAPNPCKWDTRYRSVVGLGRAALLAGHGREGRRLGGRSPSVRL